MKYSVDTSALLDARVRHYPPEVFPTLWERIEKLIQDGELVAIDEVLRELEKKDDEVHVWAKKQQSMFLPLDDAVQERAKIIINKYGSLTNPSRKRGRADPFVIALAQEHGLMVVTAESSKPSKPKIPDVCEELKIPCIRVVEMFRKEGWQV